MPTARGGSKKPDSPYHLLVERRATADLDAMEAGDWKRVDRKIVALASDPTPFGCEKLAAHTYRIRCGDWRVLYTVNDDTREVVIGRVKRRNERTYR